MITLLTAREMQNADMATITAGTPSHILMKRAAEGTLRLLLRDFDTSGTVMVFCGPGNNGGDGFVLARLLFESGKKVSVCYPGKWVNGKPDTAGMSTAAAAEYHNLPADVPVAAKADCREVSAAVDALFGVGLSRNIAGNYREAVLTLNDSGVPVLALDIPTGIHADTGKIMGCAVRASETATISYMKRGMILHPGSEYCGTIIPVEIGITAPPTECYLLESEDLSTLPARPAYSNKGSFGRVLVIGGSVGMSGAGFFAAKGAYRAGAGLVELLTPARNRTIYQRQIPEAVLTLYPEKKPEESMLRRSLSRADAVVIGMGLSGNASARSLTAWTLRGTPGNIPLIIDADGLNILSGDSTLWESITGRSKKAILTPHLGEMARLCGKPVTEIAENLIGIARDFAKTHDVILVLKDAKTVITDGTAVFLNTKGNNGMATGGSGDVLAGIISAFAAGGASPLDAAKLGVLAHAMAGDVAARQRGVRGVMASDLPDALCEVLKKIP